MKILALDPATTTGWAFYDGAAVSEVGHFTFTIQEHEGARLLEAYHWLRNIIDLFKPELVVGEGFFASGRFSNGSNVNHEIRGVFKLVSAKYGIPYVMTGPSEWKRALCGRTSPTKAEKKLYRTKDRAKKMVTVLALEKRGFAFPAKVKSGKGNLVNFKFDTSDAIGILVAELDKRSIPFVVSSELFPAEIAK